MKGGKWFSLVDKVYSSENLRASWEKVRSNGGAAGVDRQSIEVYEKETEKNLVELEKILREGSYRAKPVKRVWIPKIGSKEKRPLGIPVAVFMISWLLIVVSQTAFCQSKTRKGSLTQDLMIKSEVETVVSMLQTNFPKHHLHYPGK